MRVEFIKYHAHHPLEFKKEKKHSSRISSAQDKQIETLLLAKRKCVLAHRTRAQVIALKTPYNLQFTACIEPLDYCKLI